MGEVVKHALLGAVSALLLALFWGVSGKAVALATTLI